MKEEKLSVKWVLNNFLDSSVKVKKFWKTCLTGFKILYNNHKES